MLARTLVFIDEANLLQMGHLIGKMTDWTRVREFLSEQRTVVEFVVYAGLPPNLPEWFELRPASGSSLAMYHAAQTAPKAHSGN